MGVLRENLVINRGFRDINPLLCGRQHCSAGHSNGPALRGHYLLHYVISGKGIFSSGGKDHEVSAGQIFVIKPLESAFYRADDNTPWDYCWIAFESALELDYILRQPIIDLPQAGRIFAAMHECEGLHISKELAITAKLFELLAMLAEQQITPAEAMPPYILKAINYIENNYVEGISVTHLAASLNLDRSYFSAAFKRATNKSPQEYAVDYRLEKAAELMITHGYRPGEAGQSVGYRDIFNFSRMFKRRYGVSPTEYIQSKGEA